MSLLYPFSHSPIECHFNASARDFVVKEVPLYEPSGNGEHLMIFVRKKGLSTFEMLRLLSSTVGISVREIGYAGLKDKAANAYQYVSVHKSHRAKLESALPQLESANIKVLNIASHHNKLKLGHLKGNMFFMRLKKVSKINANKLNSVLLELEKSGFPNYFGFQRFGKDGQNHLQGEAIAKGKAHYKNHKINQFLTSSFQSHLFNEWLHARIKLSMMTHNFASSEVLEALKCEQILALNQLSKVLQKDDIKALKAQNQPLILLKGDVMSHYPFGKYFICEDFLADSNRFIERSIAPTGALCGEKLLNSQDIAQIIESHFLDSQIKAQGSRRYAWVWAENIKSTFIQQKAHFELEFFLPKGSYASVFLRALRGDYTHSELAK